MTEKKLSGRVALITGASRGIGAAVAKLFAREGAHVVLLARSKKGLIEVDDAIRQDGGAATLMPFDLTKTEELEALGPTLFQKFGRLDIFVANAGMLGDLTPLSHSKMMDWAATWQTNVLSNVQMIRTLEPLLKESDAGRAMVVGSVLGLEAEAYCGEYGVSKAAAMFLFKTWAEETRQTKLKINIINPGAVDTSMLRQVFPGGFSGIKAKVRTPDQVAPLFLELALPSCSRHGDTVTPELYGL